MESTDEEEWLSYLNKAGYISLSESEPLCCYPAKGSESKTQPSSDEVTDSFTTRSHGSSEEVPPIPEETWDTLGEPGRKFDYMVKYSAPESSRISLKNIVPTGWNSEF